MRFNWFVFFNNYLNDKNKGLYLKYYDFSKHKKIQFAPGIKDVNMSYARGLHGDVSVRYIEKLNMSHTDLRNVPNIAFNPTGQEINLSCVKGLFGELDFSQAGTVSLCGSDLEKVYSLKGAKRTNLSDAKGLVGKMDFKHTDYLDLSRTDVSRVKLSFNPMAKKINLAYAKGLSGVLDFGNTERVVLLDADLSKVTKIICGPSSIVSISSNYTGLIEKVSGKKIGKKVPTESSRPVYNHHARKMCKQQMHVISMAKLHVK
jgi:hypothetical protein